MILTMCMLITLPVEYRLLLHLDIELVRNTVKEFVSSIISRCNANIYFSAKGEAGPTKTLRWGVDEQTYSSAGFDKAVEKTYNLMFSIQIKSAYYLVHQLYRLYIYTFIRERCYGPWMSSYGLRFR